MQYPADKELNDALDSQAPLVSLESLAIPVAILSIEDGVVVYTNSPFKKSVHNCPGGLPLQELLHSDAVSQTSLEGFERSGQFILIKK